MDDQWNRQYVRLQAVEENLEQNSLLERYIALYKKKYRGEPIFDTNNIHFRHIKELKDACKEKAREILEHYFEMRDDWFIQQAYSLPCLIKNINKINADMSLRQGRVNLKDKMSIQLHCDSCGEGFTLLCGFNHDLNGLTRCEGCEKEDRRPKKRTKEERRSVILRLGGCFPDLANGN